MNLFNTISHWNEEKRKKREAMLVDQGICQDCYEHGFYSFMHESISPIECPHCHGTGLLSIGEHYNQSSGPKV